MVGALGVGAPPPLLGATSGSDVECSPEAALIWQCPGQLRSRAHTGPTGHPAVKPEGTGRTLGQLQAFTNGWACSELKLLPSSTLRPWRPEQGVSSAFDLNRKDHSSILTLLAPDCKFGRDQGARSLRKDSRVRLGGTQKDWEFPGAPWGPPPPRAPGTHAEVMREQRLGHNPPHGHPEPTGHSRGHNRGHSRGHVARHTSTPWAGASADPDLGPRGPRAGQHHQQCTGQGIQGELVPLGLILVSDKTHPLPVRCLWFAGFSALSPLSWYQIKRPQPYRFLRPGGSCAQEALPSLLEAELEEVCHFGPDLGPWGTSREGVGSNSPRAQQAVGLKVLPPPPRRSARASIPASHPAPPQCLGSIRTSQ